MEFKDVLDKRYSVTKYSSTPIEESKLHAIFKAAQSAPTAANKQPQRIICLTSEDELKKIDECTPCRYDAPVVFIICYDTKDLWRRSYDSMDSGQIDCSIVGTYMMLEAVNQGLGTIWVMHFDPAKLRQVFNIADDLEPVSLLIAGYAAEDAFPRPQHTSRKSIDEIIKKR